MSNPFDYDVFLSYRSQDTKTVHALAERLKGDGLRQVIFEGEAFTAPNVARLRDRLLLAERPDRS